MAKVALSYGHGSNTYEDKRSKFVIKNGKVYEEHTHNYQVGVRVRDILKAHGVSVLEVQPANGKDVALSTRTKKANDWGADLYWSIHANAGTPSAKGWCAFWWQGSKEGQKASRLYADEMKAIGLPMYSDGDYMSQRGTWSDFHELRETKMVAVLTENGFMTNSEDFKKIFLNEGNYYDKAAIGHAKAILRYFGIAYKGAEVASTPTAKPASVDTSKGIGVATVTVDKLNFRKDKSLSSPVVKVLEEGERYYVYQADGQWFNLGGGWASAGSKGQYLKYTAHPEKPKPKPAPPKSDTYRVILNGKQVGAYSEDSNVVQIVKEAIEDGVKDVSIEKV
jgi:N-acetylmuramoyl-L-alanine amidase